MLLALPPHGTTPRDTSQTSARRISEESQTTKMKTTAHMDGTELIQYDMKSIVIGLYRENAIAIESEANYTFGGNVYYVTMQITLPIAEFTRNKRNLHCDELHITTIESPNSFWMKRSQPPRRVLLCSINLYDMTCRSKNGNRNVNEMSKLFF